MGKWPGGCDFAFTIIDDTDMTTMENGPLVYELLGDLGVMTTKSVWMFDGDIRPDNRNIIGTTCQDARYREWVRTLQAQGFEIALHSASWSRSTRSRVIEALELFNQYFGSYPKILVQHNDSVPNESMYWGPKRVGGVYRVMYELLMAIKREQRNIYHGHDENSPYFWGDICKEKIKYVRNFVYPGINTLSECPAMPYYDPERPYVNYWFAATEGPDVSTFNASLSEANQERLAEEGGASIVYTHFGNGFVVKGRLNSEFRRLMDSLARRNGWFVPVGGLLDYLLETRGPRTISHGERSRLERRWLWHKMTIGTS
jgi:hypothetical protein